MWKAWNDLINLFYPNLCRLCNGKLVEGEEQLCLKCLCQLPRTGFHLRQNNLVEQLLIDKKQLLQASAFLYYEQGSHVRQLIHSIKYYDNKRLGFLLGRQAALEWMEHDCPLRKVELLLPIPLHPRKLRKRGYNQSEWIALGIQSVLDIPLCTTAVNRQTMTESQTKKLGYERWLNVKDIFSVDEPEKLTGKHILLVDDVITTGSTAAACMDALSAFPDIQISFFTLSIAHH